MPNQILAVLPQKQYACTWRINIEEGFAYLAGLPDAVFGGKVGWELFGGKVRWDFLAQHYGTGKDGVYIGFEADGSPRKDHSPPWQEINFGSFDPSVEIDDQNSAYIVHLLGQRLDSYTIQSLRRHKITSENNLVENSVQGILAKNGKFILGCRGGYDLSGTLQPIPGGSVLWKEHYDKSPIEDGFTSETEEEAGTKVINPKLYGVFNQTGVHTNRQWLFVAEPNQSLEHIAEAMAGGLELYLKEKERNGGNEALARIALRESSYPIDSWENASTVIFSYDPETFLRLLSDGKWVSPKGERMCLIGTLWADLYLAGMIDFGEEFGKAVDKIPAVKEAVTF